jgi:hypothetical protein
VNDTTTPSGVLPEDAARLPEVAPYTDDGYRLVAVPDGLFDEMRTVLAEWGLRIDVLPTECAVSAPVAAHLISVLKSGAHAK